MKIYFNLIKYLQEILLWIAVGTMMYLPLMIAFRPDVITGSVTLGLYLIAHLFLFFVMMIRPLADIITSTKWIRPLVILRKGAGVMSASIVVSFILAKLMVDPSGYLASFGTLKYWSLINYAVLAHMADISAIILIITSNNLSKRIMGDWWKKVQNLSYVYFYGSVLYVYLTYGGAYLLVALILVTALTFTAFLKNKRKQRLSEQVSMTESVAIGPNIITNLSSK